MKKMILTGTVILGLAAANLQSARAGDREWATVGKVLTGVAVAGLIVAATDGHAQCNVNYTYSAPAYCPPPAPPCNVAYYPAPPPPVVYCPPPVIVYREPALVYSEHRWHDDDRGYYGEHRNYGERDNYRRHDRW